MSGLHAHRCKAGQVSKSDIKYQCEILSGSDRKAKGDDRKCDTLKTPCYPESIPGMVGELTTTLIAKATECFSKCTQWITWAIITR